MIKVAIIGVSDKWYDKQWKKAAKKLGAKVSLIKMKDVVLRIDQKKGIRAQFWEYDRKEKKVIIRDFKDYDILLRRWMKKYYLQSLVLGWYMKKMGKVVLNSKLEMILDKISQAIRFYEAGLPHPLTWQALRSRNAKRLLGKVKKFPIIIKPLSGTMGQGIYKAKSRSGAMKIFTKKALHGLLIQRDLDIKKDIRIIVIGNKCLGAMKRIAPPGDFRSNVALGASTEPYELTPHLRELALKAARAMGYEICGVDIMFKEKKPYVLEVNRTPQFRGFTRTLKIPVAEEMLKFAIEEFKKRGSENKSQISKIEFKKDKKVEKKEKIEKTKILKEKMEKEETKEKINKEIENKKENKSSNKKNKDKNQKNKT